MQDVLYLAIIPNLEEFVGNVEKHAHREEMKDIRTSIAAESQGAAE